MAKKIDPKAREKQAIMDLVAVALAKGGYDVLDGGNFGFSSGTVVVRGSQFDIQLKPIATKSGTTRYEVVDGEMEYLEKASDYVVEETDSEATEE